MKSVQDENKMKWKKNNEDESQHKAKSKTIKNPNQNKFYTKGKIGIKKSEMKTQA